jgi:hypothetical protein
MGRRVRVRVARKLARSETDSRANEDLRDRELQRRERLAGLVERLRANCAHRNDLQDSENSAF